MLSLEPGWTVAKPPETVVHKSAVFLNPKSFHFLHVSFLSSEMSGMRRTEELLAAGGLLDNLNETGSQLLNGGNVAGEDTHVTSLGGNVDLNAVGPKS